LNLVVGCWIDLLKEFESLEVEFFFCIVLNMDREDLFCKDFFIEDYEKFL